MRNELLVRPGAYYDSVTLMQVSHAISKEPGVRAALVAMGTELNLDMAVQMGFDRPDAGPGDLVVALQADDDHALAAALAAVDRELAASSAPAAPSSGEPPARTVRAAASRSGALLALVSVPGAYAFCEAMEALEAGLSVMVFSDNVTVGEEVALKDAAAARSLLVMGPDCGTAIVAGAALGFANVVQRGPVGMVAASGTGAQQMSCLLDTAGVGISHLLGVGGRDLSAEIGGRSALTALAALAADPATEVIAVVSKPAAPDVSRHIAKVAAECGKPVVMAVLRPGGDDLTTATEQVLSLLGHAAPSWPAWGVHDVPEPLPGSLRGLFSGGTLCDEAMMIASAALGEVRSNIPLRPEWRLTGLRARGHTMIDFGDDALTVGRPHPMIDSTLRLAELAAAAEDPETSVLIMDVVLGYGANADPAGELAPAISDARDRAHRAGRQCEVVVSLCGTNGDPQSLQRQADRLVAGGAQVFCSNAAAARHAVHLLGAEVSQ